MRRDVFTAFGVVMGQVQTAEKLIGLLAATFSMFASTAAGKKVDLGQLFTETRRRTLGQLCHTLMETLGELDPEKPAPGAFDNLLVELLRARNWLAHHYVHDRGALLGEPKHYKMLRDELLLFSQHFSAALQMIRAYCDGIDNILSKQAHKPFDEEAVGRERAFEEYRELRASVRRLRATPPFGIFG